MVEAIGEVRRPMAYELVGGETVSDLIAMSGGLTRDAFASLATLVRASLEGGYPALVPLTCLINRRNKFH